MSNEAIKVKVKSYTHPNAWYVNEIENVFEVKTASDDEDFWYIVGKKSWDRNAFILKSDCEIISTAHPQDDKPFDPQTQSFNTLANPVNPKGEPKTNEEILKEFFIEYETDMVIDDKVMSVFMASDESKMAIKIMQAARVSERAQISAEQKAEIPQCLQECRLTESERGSIIEHEENVHEAVDATQSILIHNFYLLLSQVKGLPQRYDPDSIRTPEGDMPIMHPDDNGFYVRTAEVSLLLLQRDEAHKAEVEQQKQSAMAFIAEASDLMDFCIDRGYLDNEDITEGQQKFMDAKAKLLDLFLKEKEGEA